jgi:indole-3-glycerol phosphate synthase
VSDVLTRICDDTRALVALRKTETPLADVERAAKQASPVRGFADRLAAAMEAGGYGLIAEIKKASPSQGLIRRHFDPAALARAYRSGGAACLSVLTDEKYFQGKDEYLGMAREASDLPVLRKDFMVDPYQVVEARAIGADCILVILAAVDDALARELADAAAEYGMDCLVEVHDAPELDRALALDCRLIGVNNRDLKTLKTDLATTEALAGQVPPDRLLVCESGIETPEHLARMAQVGAHCFLVGTSLMMRDDVAAATRTLLSPPIVRMANA